MRTRSASVSSQLFVLAILLFPMLIAGQDSPKPPARHNTEDSPSRWDIFAGYSYLAPKGTVQVLQTDHVTVRPESFKSADSGLIGSGSFFFNKYLGMQVESGAHDLWSNRSSSNGGFATISGGLIARFPTPSVAPFIHGMVGGARVGGPDHEPYKWGVDLTAGGGMDYPTPWLHKHLSIRLFQADYEYMHVNWGPGVWQGRANLNSARLSTGLVFHVGSIAPPPQLTVACSATPASVFPGEPVTVVATAGSQDPKLNVVYSLSGEGVSAGNGPTATVDTAALAPGTHTVKCDAKEGKSGKEGIKPWEVATGSTATFTVKEFEPPTVSCSVSPTSIKAGDEATITAAARSPQNRPLTYTYSTSAGSANGNGSTATYSSTGAPTGSVDITCSVADDKGHSATANTSLTIEAPPAPPQPHTQTLCTISFAKDKARPTRVDNEAKACLDEVALDLQRQSDATAVLVGESNSVEKAKEEKAAAAHKRVKGENHAAQRAVNTKDYLVKEKGIDAARISVATGTNDSQNVENYLVPAGARFSSDVTGTQPVDENQVHPQIRKPLRMRAHHRHRRRAR
jgi:hypothetical protein